MATTMEAERVQTPSTAPELTEQNLTDWKEYILPEPEELGWQEIPWRASFGTAVDESLRTEKPLLLWMMNGHPLACT
jgi:hypothetical protein